MSGDFSSPKANFQIKPCHKLVTFASSTDSFTVLFSKLLKLFRAWKVTGIFTKQAPGHKKNLCKLLQIVCCGLKASFPMCMFVSFWEASTKSGLDQIGSTPYIFPPNNRRLGIVFWGSIQFSPIQVLSTAHSERLIHKVKTFVERLLLVKICFYNKQHIHK